MEVRGNFSHKRLLEFFQPIEKRTIVAIELIAGPSQDGDAIEQGPLDAGERDLRFCLKLYLVPLIDSRNL